MALIFSKHIETPKRFPLKTSLIKLKRAKDFITEHFSENITLEQLSQSSGLTQFHFVRAFAKVFGLPPHTFQTHVRLTKARQLLYNGVSPSHLDVGFADQSHLTRHFKKAFGITPGQYAASTKAAKFYM
jgi:AraC-like DNA-binding protein